MQFLEKKLFFDSFDKKWRGGAWDIFVERIKLYHSLKVHDNCIFIYGDMGLKMKTPTDHEKKVVPNSVDQLFFVPNSGAPANLCP